MDQIDEKIQESDLRRFATATSTDDRRSVIVELKVPPAHLGAEALPSKPPRFYDREILPQAADEQARQCAAMDELEAELHSLGLVQGLRRLDLAQAFVASASPEQLRSIANLSMVGAIRPNRSHRATAT
jgi:hypothetical protein